MDHLSSIFGGDSTQSEFRDHIERTNALRGVLQISGEIFEDDAAVFAAKLMFLFDVGVREFTIYLCSPGGEVYPALGVFDSIRAIIGLGAVVKVKVRGQAASAASMILLQAASEGERVATPHSRIHLHEPSGWLGSASQSQIRDTHQHLEVLGGIINTILGDRMGITATEVAKLYERKELWLSPQEAVDLKILDKIEY